MRKKGIGVASLRWLITFPSELRSASAGMSVHLTGLRNAGVSTLGLDTADTSTDGWVDSLKMKCTTAPFFRSDIGDSFGEVPVVAVKVLSIVLALAIGVLLRFSQDGGSVPSRALAMTLGIVDANLNHVRLVGRDISFGDGEAALAGLHLDAVIGDAESGGEAKGL
jgi:hypothetical protein